MEEIKETNAQEETQVVKIEEVQTPKPKSKGKVKKVETKPEEAPVVAEDSTALLEETLGIKPEEAPIEMPKPKPLTMILLKAELDTIASVVASQAMQIKELKDAIEELKAHSAKTITRKALPTGKCQIKDTVTGKTYKSKNNTYQSMLKAGELKDLVDKGVFGADPAKNNFGWFALDRAYPNRFEAIKEETPNGNA